MKRYTRALIASSILMALVGISCSLVDLGSGTISFTIPEEVLAATTSTSRSVSSRAVLETGESIGYIRVYLEAHNSLIPFGSTNYYEAAIPASRTIEVADISPIRDCSLYISLSVEGGANFRAVKYAASKATFNITAGSTAEVTVVTQGSPFEDIAEFNGSYLADKAGVRTVEVDGRRYFLAKERLYWEGGPTAGLAAAGANGLAVGHALTIDGTEGTFGDEQLWINTSNGIFVFSNGAIGTEELTGKTFASNGKILESGTLSVQNSDKSETLRVAYYQRPGSFGVATFDDEDGAWGWIDLYDLFDGTSEYYDENFKDLEDLIKDSTSKLITDVCIREEFGYVLSSITKIRIGPEAEESLSNADGFTGVKDALEGGGILSVPKDGTASPSIQTVSHAGSTLFLGTSLGLYSAITDSAGKVQGTPGKVTLPDSVNVSYVRAAEIGGVVWAAALGKKGNLYLIKNGQFLKKYRFYTGLPQFNDNAASTATIQWADDGLVIAGTDGAVLLPNETLSSLK